MQTARGDGGRVELRPWRSATPTGPVISRGIDREPGWSPDWRCRDCWYMWLDGDPLAGKVERELEEWLKCVLHED